MGNIEKRKSADLCADMRRKGLQTMQEITHPSKPRLSAAEEAGPLGYEYLLSMKLWSLTEDRVATLKKQYEAKQAELEELRSTSLETLWERDLVSLEEALDENDAEDAKEAEIAAKMMAKQN